MPALVLSHPTATTYTVTQPVVNRVSPLELGEWTLADVLGSGIYFLTALRILNPGPAIVIDDEVPQSAYEYAIQLGAVGGDDGGFYGNVHGFERLPPPLGGSIRFLLDEGFVSLGVGGSISGDILNVIQYRTTLLPPLGGAGPPPGPIAGYSRTLHQFTSRGLRVRQPLHRYVTSSGLTPPPPTPPTASVYNPSYDVVDTAYGMMLPCNGASIDRVQIGSNPVSPVLHDDGVKDNTQATTAQLLSTTHPYAVRLTLPRLLPRSDGLGWTQDETLKMWWLDRALPSGPKIYTNFVQRNFAPPAPRGRVPATSSIHQQRYQVIRA